MVGSDLRSEVYIMEEVYVRTYLAWVSSKREKRKTSSLPTCLPTCPPACLPACLPAYPVVTLMSGKRALPALALPPP